VRLNALAIAGWPLAALFFWLLLEARQDVGEATEVCNTEKMAAVAEAERVTKETTEAAYERRLAEMEARAEDEREATALANMAREDAVRNAEAAQARIRQLIIEAQNDETATISQVCLSTTVDTAAIDGLR
jgi:hypothetical protein